MLSLSDKAYYRLIVIISIAIPLAVAVLFFLPKELRTADVDFSFIPAVNATINSMVTLFLIAGYLAIRAKNQLLHKSLMLSAFFLSALFLVLYVMYHTFEQRTDYGGDAPLKYIYYFILLTHILLSIAIVPLVLITIYRSTTGQYEAHRKIARWTLPIWLYVSITGVLVYLLISPYYQHG